MKNPTILDVAKPLALLAACPAYKPSLLETRSLQDRPILIKDETNRMGLGAFKALGGVYAVAKLIEARVGHPLEPNAFLDESVKAIARSMTFVCASAGNHGMAVAAGARLFGAKARIHLAETVPEDFAIRLRCKGAEVVRSGDDYEASVAAAIADAEASGAIHLADGSWPGYTEPPRLVMEGYTVIAEEMRIELENSGNWPSHVYLQAGVGGLAAGIAYMIRSTWAVQPKIIVVEPDAAPCLAESTRAGQIVTVEGPVSNMGRLDCKTPSMLALEILERCADDWVTVTDLQALDAVKHARDLGFSTTPSGAAGLAALLTDEAKLPLIVLSEGDVPDA
ncbi:pyridoxal-phosphate dependent enzyme [Ruegeria sp. A3M17]|uniref:pyridoxal-phosphate dependent enzyme n=1 Tax=Ruegeria sp. A3M17 TaxID=2267229 RepID=UPI000DE8017B|nr:pyridoxal-phosphate dependent enzyme [Ruegeria sp. A3M17]RBW53754.1 PLP-dependent lyase/thiolase [Ruegeria sp. A3M17]